MELIKAENLVKNYQNTKVLKNVNLTVHEGEFIGIMGKHPESVGRSWVLSFRNFF